MKSGARPHILFVTGKLAEPSLRATLQALSMSGAFTWSIAVLPITVAALATCEWIGRHLQRPEGISRIVLPGLCAGSVEDLVAAWKIPVEKGPNDLRDLPEYFGGPPVPADYGDFDIEIVAEINRAPRLDWPDLLAAAKKARADGADVIDLGCDPGTTWTGAAAAVRMLRDQGLRVSIDSFNPVETASAAKAGAELVLSVNSTNARAAADWGCEVVAVPDVPQAIESLDATVELLDKCGVRFRVDPILEPIGLGFGASLERYWVVRKRYPEIAILMGVGNLTELTDVDSAGVNVMLLGFCQEVGIRSVLTTEVINWCRSSIRELDRARRLVYHAVTRRVLPKRLEPELVMLRDTKLREHGEAALRELAKRITDRNYRLFAERGSLHVLSGLVELHGDDPFTLFSQMLERDDIEASHAFYLGYEMAKAVTALTLGKNYVQDQALHWGMLTKPEHPHRPNF